MSCAAEQSQTKKRKRDPIFTPPEKMSFMEIIQNHYSIIECKKTDHLTNRSKINEWKKICHEFNASNKYMERDVTALRNLWDNLKKRAKVSMALANENRYATGGGPPKDSKDSKDDSISDMVISLIKTHVGGFHNPFDSDAAGTSSEGVLGNEDRESYDQQPAKVLINGDWSSYTPALLKTKRPSVLIEGCLEDLEVDNNDEEASQISNEYSVHKDVMESDSKILRAPKIASASRFRTNRRRPILKESEAAALAKAKMNTLKTTIEYAKSEHEATMRILKLQEEQETERLNQEKEKTSQEEIKTEMLRIQLKQLKKESLQ